MAKRRDGFSARVQRDLAERVNHMCSLPDCRAQTAGPRSDGRALRVGVAAHIHAASTGGPRFDPSQTPEERRAGENGIWVCANCHLRVDGDASRYSADELRTWKADAEADADRKMGRSPRATPTAETDHAE